MWPYQISSSVICALRVCAFLLILPETFFILPESSHWYSRPEFFCEENSNTSGTIKAVYLMLILGLVFLFLHKQHTVRVFIANWRNLSQNYHQIILNKPSERQIFYPYITSCTWDFDSRRGVEMRCYSILKCCKTSENSKFFLRLLWKQQICEIKIFFEK